MRGHIKPELLEEYEEVRSAMRSIESLIETRYFGKRDVATHPEYSFLSQARASLRLALEEMRVEL